MFEAAAKPTRAENDALDGARVRFLFDGMPVAMAATVVLAGITTLILASVEPARTLYTWYAVVVLLTGARTVQFWRYRRALRSGAPMHWQTLRRQFLFGCSLIGLAWGVAAVLFFPQDLAYQVFLSFVIAGTSAGAVTTLSSDRTAALLFVVPSITPLALMLLAQGTSFGLAMGLMVILYLLLVIAATHRSHVQLIQSVREATAQRAALARSELEPRVSDEKLRALFEFSPLGIALLDARNHVLEANPALMELLGFTSADLQQPQAHPALRALSRLPLGEQVMTSTGSPGSSDHEIVRRDSRRVAVSVNSMRIESADGEAYVWAFFEDITERKAAELGMRALSDRLMMATEAANLGIWEFDPQSGEFFWDRRMHELLDSDPAASQDLFTLWRQRLHPDDIQLAIKHRAAAQAEGNTFEYEYRIRRLDGAERSLRIVGRSAMDPNRGRLRATGVAWDITELKHVERLKGEFLATISHELRTPLTSIHAALGLIANGTAGTLAPQVQHLLTIADRNAERLTLLIDDLLDIEKIEAGKLRMQLTPRLLLPLLRQAVQAQAAQARACSVELHVLPGGEGLVANVDAGRFLQVMANLLSNAAKFSTPHTTVDVQLTQRADMAHITVTDRGPGIPHELRERLFTKFSQGDSSDSRGRGGTGLGLAICKALVEQMGGSIGYESTLGTGTTFYFELPLVTVQRDDRDGLA